MAGEIARRNARGRIKQTVGTPSTEVPPPCLPDPLTHWVLYDGNYLSQASLGRKAARLGFRDILRFRKTEASIKTCGCGNSNRSKHVICDLTTKDLIGKRSSGLSHLQIKAGEGASRQRSREEFDHDWRHSGKGQVWFSLLVLEITVHIQMTIPQAALRPRAGFTVKGCAFSQ